MKKTRIVALMLVLVLVLSSFVGCSNSNKAKATDGETKKEVYKLKIASILSDNDPETLGLKKFKELLEEKTDGQIVVEVYPNGQLGSAETYLDTLRQGTIQMASPGSVMAQLQPLVAAPEMPFLFRDWDHARKVLTDKEITDKLVDGLIEKHGIRAIGFAPRSFRVMTFNKDIKNFDDLQGVRLRVPNIPFYIKFAEAIGTSPVALPFTELFSGLEQGVVDGQENPYATINTSKFYEVQKYIVETNHIFTVHGWYLNEEFFQSLPADLQTILLEVADEAIGYTFDISIEAETESKKLLVDEGVTITVPDEEFRSKIMATKDTARAFFYDTYAGSKEWAEIVDAVK